MVSGMAGPLVVLTDEPFGTVGALVPGIPMRDTATATISSSVRHHRGRHIPHTIGQRIASIRVRKLVTQVELAEMTGLRQATVSDIERGAKMPSVSTIRRIAHALRVRPADILDGQANTR